MELALAACPIILIFLLLLFSFRFHRKNVTHSNGKYPPGPWTLPIIGSLHHLAAAKLPHRTLHDLALVHGPVILLRAGEVDLVVISSREAAREVMKTQDAKLAKRPPLTAANVLLYGTADVVFSNSPYWRQMRRICVTELLSSKRVKSFSLIRQEEITAVLKSISIARENSPVNLSEMMPELSNNIIIRAAFGGMCNSNTKGKFFKVLPELLELFSGFNFSDLFPSLSWLNVSTKIRLTRLHSELDSIMNEVLMEHLKQRKKAEGEVLDLVDVLVNIMEGGDLEVPLTMDSIKAIILDMFLGGTESSSTVTIWAMTELMKNPEIMAKVQAEIRHTPTEKMNWRLSGPSYLKQVIKETLRLHPIAPLLVPRLSEDSCEILGHIIPSNARVVINAWALGRNTDYWYDSEEFKPERFQTSNVDFNGNYFEFVPFGAGRRICPGLEFGTVVVEETLASLLLHFDWKLPGGMRPEDLDMTENFGIAAGKKEPLRLIPILRVPLPNV